MPATPSIVRFGVFELDLESQELSKNGRRLKLQEQPFRILTLLLENPGGLVSREKLREALWPSDTFVDFDHSLNAAMAKLRQALGDSASNPRFIETMAKRGYRFIAPVNVAANGIDVLDSPASEPRPQIVAGNVPPAVIASPSRLSLRVALWTCAALAAIVGIIFFIAWRSRTPRVPGGELVKLTSGPGLTTDPAISPDGKFLAFASDRGGSGNLNLWVQPLNFPDRAVQLTHDAYDARQPAFSPDGTSIAYHSGSQGGGIFVIPVIGGQPTRVTRFGRDPRFSPDGRFIAFWHSGTDSITVPVSIDSGVYVVPVSGGEPKRVGADLYAAMSPVWSADGKRLLVYVPPRRGYSWNEADWWIVSVAGAPSVRTGAFAELARQSFSIGFERVPSASQWTERSITFAAAVGDAMNAWRAPASREGRITGPAERLTSGTNLENQAAWNSDGDLIFASLNRSASIWSLPADTDRGAVTGELKRVSGGDEEFLPSVSADAVTLAFTSVASAHGFPANASQALMTERAHLETRIRNLSTGNEAVIRGPEGPQWHPQVSRDGAMVAWTIGKPGVVYAEPVSGGSPREIVAGANAFVWDWSLDRKRILLNRFDPAGQRLYQANVDNGHPQLFTDRPGFRLFQARFSPDDRAIALLACHSDQCQIFIAPRDHGFPVAWQKWIAIDHVSNWDDKPRWLPSGDLLYFVSDRDGYLCLWAQRLDKNTFASLGAPFAVRHLHMARLSMSNLDTGALEIAIGKDRILLGLGELTGNIWMAQKPH